MEPLTRDDIINLIEHSVRRNVEASLALTSASATSAPSKTTPAFNALSSLVSSYYGDPTPGVCRQWLSKLDQAFTLLSIDDSETDKEDQIKVSYALLRLKGPAEEWSSAKRKVLSTKSWDGFKKALTERFDPSMEFLELQLTSLRQESQETLEDYYTRFGSIAETILAEDSSTTEMAKAAFIQGMQDRYQRLEVIKSQDTRSFAEALDLVISWERKEAVLDNPRAIHFKQNKEASKKNYKDPRDLPPQKR